MNGKKSNLVKWLILGAILIVIISIISLLMNRDNVDEQTENIDKNYTESGDGTKTNTSNLVSENKEVGDVLLEQSKIIYTGGTSKLTSKVTNNGVAKDNLRFKVKFISNDGSVMSESIGFVGQINQNEVKYIDSYITIDVSNAKNVMYELME